LAHLGVLDFWTSLLFILAGGVGKTLLGYYIGEVLHRHFRNMRVLKYINKRVNHFLPHFQRKPFWSIFISKFIMGANHIVIIFCGFQKINYGKFLKAELTATLIWAPAL